MRLRIRSESMGKLTTAGAAKVAAAGDGNFGIYDANNSAISTEEACTRLLLEKHRGTLVSHVNSSPLSTSDADEGISPANSSSSPENQTASEHWESKKVYYSSSVGADPSSIDGGVDGTPPLDNDKTSMVKGVGAGLKGRYVWSRDGGAASLTRAKNSENDDHDEDNHYCSESDDSQAITLSGEENPQAREQGVDSGKYSNLRRKDLLEGAVVEPLL